MIYIDAMDFSEWIDKFVLTLGVGDYNSNKLG